MYISINGDILHKNDSNISVLSTGFMYGFGLFETMKVFNKNIIFLNEHIDRLSKACDILNIEFNKKYSDVIDDCYDLIHKNDIDFGTLKVIYFKNISDFDLVITTSKKYYEKEMYVDGFKLKLSEIKKNPYSNLTYIKSNNYLENLIEKNKVNNEGFDEVIFTNIYDKISEGAISNIFFIKDNIINTPSIKCGILPGIVRKKVIDLGIENNFKVICGEFNVDELLKADEVFITNSLLDIMPVSKFNNGVYDMNEYKTTKKLMDSYYKEYYYK